jgi:hypothetical protein
LQSIPLAGCKFLVANVTSKLIPKERLKQRAACILTLLKKTLFAKRNIRPLTCDSSLKL